MNLQQQNAAHSLGGKTLKNGWIVNKKIEPSENSTGGFFSVCYEVTKDGQTAFLKALNFQAFFQLFGGRSVLEILNEQTTAYKYEKELLMRCKNNRLSKVSLILDEGEENIDGFTIGTVPYLIFEMADGDIRSKINFSKSIDISWKLRSLHNVAVGIRQLHNISIGHQDLKPSNVLIYNQGLSSKIGDLGRSLCKDLVCPHENGGNFPGDFNYAPPEFLYQYIESDWNVRIKSTDLYLFGSLIVFYFTGTNMTALIGKNMDKQFIWTNWSGNFDEVKGYLINGFYEALKEFESSIENKKLAQELTNLVSICCFPLPEKRGYPKNDVRNFSQYDFQRIISKIDLLTRKIENQFL